MRKSIIILAFCFLALSCACKKQSPANAEPAVPEEPQKPRRERVTFIGDVSGDDTKVAFEWDGRTTYTHLWEGDEPVTVFEKSDESPVNREYTVENPPKDPRRAIFVFDGEDASEGYDPEAEGYNYACYPYTKDNSLSFTDEGDAVLNVSYESVQPWRPGTYGSTVMFGRSQTERIPFTNGGGWLKLSLRCEENSAAFVTDIASLTLSSNAGEGICGRSDITIAGDGTSFEIGGCETPSVTVDCSEQDGGCFRLDPENITYVYFFVHPVTFDKGFTISVRNTLGNEVCKIATQKKFTIARNKVLAMSAVRVRYATTFEVEVEEWGSDEGEVTMDD